MSTHRSSERVASSTARAKRILVVDDHPVVHEGLERILSVESDLTMCGKAATVREAVALVDKLKPDLIISDLTFPEGSGLELVKDIKALHPEIPVLVMSMHDELIYAERVLRAGGRGYLMKDTASDFLIAAIHKILGGGVHASSAVTEHFLHSLSEGGKRQASFPLKRLSDREIEVFELMGNGKSTQEIAGQLHISPRTVDAHRAHIKDKLGLADSAQLTRYAIRWMESGPVE